jgi:hypothetical protein
MAGDVEFELSIEVLQTSEIKILIRGIFLAVELSAKSS